jgi:hypothetical protein
MFSAKCFHFLKAFGSLITLLENRRVYLSKILPTCRRVKVGASAKYNIRHAVMAALTACCVG